MIDNWEKHVKEEIPQSVIEMVEHKCDQPITRISAKGAYETSL